MAGYLIEERRRWPVITASPRGQCSKLSNRRAIGEHTSTAVNCIPPAEVALNLAFGDFERNGDIYGHWGRD